MRWLMLALVAAFAVLIRAPNVEACSPAPMVGNRTLLVPAPPSLVPLNSLIRVHFTYGSDVRHEIQVRPVGGAPIALTTDVVVGHHRTILVAKAVDGLAANTTYEVLDRIVRQYCYSFEVCYGDWAVYGTFRTGTRIDADPPTFRGLREVSVSCYSTERPDSCGVSSTVGHSLLFDAPMDDSPGVLLNVYAADGKLVGPFSDGPGYSNGGALAPPRGDFLIESGYIVRAVDIAGNVENNAVVVSAPGCPTPDGGTVSPAIDGGPASTDGAVVADGGARADGGDAACEVGPARGSRTRGWSIVAAAFACLLLAIARTRRVR